MTGIRTNALIRELTMQSVRGFNIYGARLFRCVVNSKTVTLFLELDLRQVFFPLPGNTFWQIASAPSSLIEHIGVVVRRPKIVKTIVQAVTIPMVYLWCVFSCFHAPNKPVNHPSGLHQANASVSSIWGDIVSALATMLRIPTDLHSLRSEMMRGPFSPCQGTRFPIIGEAFAKECLRW